MVLQYWNGLLESKLALRDSVIECIITINKEQTLLINVLFAGPESP